MELNKKKEPATKHSSYAENITNTVEKVNEPNYIFRFTIETEDGEILEKGWTYIGSISEYGECESVDMETGKYLRIFKKKLEENN